MTDPDKPPAWTIRARLTQGEDEPEPAAVTEPETDVVPPEWSKAVADVRANVKWVVAALGAIGAVLFAKGLITTPDLNWTDDRTNLVMAWALGAAGLTALAWLLFEAVGALRPTAYELGTLPRGYVAMIDSDPAFYLPGTSRNVAEFQKSYLALRHEDARWRDEVASAQARLDRVNAAESVDEEARAAAVLDLERTRLTSISVAKALAVHVGVRKDLVDRASYWSAAQGFGLALRRIVVAGVVAAVGGIGYQLVLAPGGPDDDEAPASPRVALLQQTDTAAGRQLWELFGLGDCETDPGTGVISVVLAGGKGTPDDPYVVSTLPDANCVPRKFTVINEVAVVSEPVTTSITYEPADDSSASTGPTPSSSGSDPPDDTEGGQAQPPEEDEVDAGRDPLPADRPHLTPTAALLAGQVATLAAQTFLTGVDTAADLKGWALDRAGSATDTLSSELIKRLIQEIWEESDGTVKIGDLRPEPHGQPPLCDAVAVAIRDRLVEKVNDSDGQSKDLQQDAEAAAIRIRDALCPALVLVAPSREPVRPTVPKALEGPSKDPESGDSSRAQVVREVVVGPGDSLWTIARRESTSASRVTIARLVRLIWAQNLELIGADPDALEPGMRLRFTSPGSLT